MSVSGTSYLSKTATQGLVDLESQVRVNLACSSISDSVDEELSRLVTLAIFVFFFTELSEDESKQRKPFSPFAADATLARVETFLDPPLPSTLLSGLMNLLNSCVLC